MAKRQKSKETEEIRAKLDSFAGLQRKIDNQIERLEALISTMDSPSSPNLTGLPSGGFDGVSKTERLVIKKIELEDKIRKLEAKEASLRAEIEQLIEQLKSPDEQTVIEMRYLDRRRWWPICAALFATEKDYEENAEKYLKRTFKIHGCALVSLSMIYEQSKASE